MIKLSSNCSLWHMVAMASNLLYPLFISCIFPSNNLLASKPKKLWLLFCLERILKQRRTAVTNTQVIIIVTQPPLVKKIKSKKESSWPHPTTIVLFLTNDDFAFGAFSWHTFKWVFWNVSSQAYYQKRNLHNLRIKNKYARYPYIPNNHLW